MNFQVKQHKSQYTTNQK